MARQGPHQYVALLPDVPEYARLAGPNLRVVIVPGATRANLLLREWWLNVTVRKLCRKEKADGLFCIGNFVPHVPPVPTVVLLQDAHYVYPGLFMSQDLTFRQRLILRYGWLQYRCLARNVTVLVQTEVMKRRFVSLYGIAPSRVQVIRDRGSALEGFPAASGNNGRKDASGAFTFLCVAVWLAHKNLEVLVEAVKILRTLTDRRFRCLLTVDPREHPGAKKLLLRIEREGVSDVLVNIGRVPPEQLRGEYGKADVFILPTLLESFGRPYDEAMQFELPILTSDRDFAHERCQDAALYFDPLDSGSVARAMLTAMESAELRQRLVENGRRLLAKAPSWDEVASGFVEVLERAARQEIAVT